MQNKFTSKLQAKRKNSFCRRLITFTAFLFISIFLPSFPDHLLFNNSFKVLLERFDASCLNRFSLEHTPWAVCVTFAMKHFFAQYILLKKKKKISKVFQDHPWFPHTQIYQNGHCRDEGKFLARYLWYIFI